MESKSVNHPSHYNSGGIECIDAMMSAFGKSEVKTFCKLNAFKYLWRSSHKGREREDMEKAGWYIREWVEIDNRHDPCDNYNRNPIPNHNLNLNGKHNDNEGEF